MADEYGYGVFATFGEGGYQDFAAMNKGVTPIFFTEDEPDGIESEKQGRAVFRQTERVRIHIAGDPFSAPVHPVDEFYKMRFADAYRQWQANRTRHVAGTPLKQWPMATSTQIKELEAINIYSVEDLANIADVHLSRIPDGRVWRERAAAFLNFSKDAAAAQKYAADNERLREEMADLRALVMDRKPSQKSRDRSEAMKAIWARRKAKAAEKAA